jgi:hypothetical protein
MTIRTLEIGAVKIPLPAVYNFSQSYEAIGGSALLRMMSGAGIKQSHWNRLRTNISGGGLLPIGLSTVDFSVSHVLKCATPRLVYANSNVITIPANRRTDAGYEPYAFAFMPDHTLKSISLSVVNHVATCAVTSGAVAYAVGYTPQFTAFMNPPNESYDVTNAEPSWDLVAEEV